MIDLSTSYLGLALKNPVIVGSCGLTENIDSLFELEKAGAAAVVLKSLFEEEILHEMKLNLGKMSTDMDLYPETVGYYDELDVPQESPEKYLELIKDAKHGLSIPVIASINCITAGQWTYFPKRIEAAGADALELNLFILPTDLSRSAAENEKIYFDIISEVTRQVKIPVSIKVSFYFSNLANMLKKLSESDVEGIVLFNKFYSPDIDIDRLEITSGSVLSSPGDIANTLRWIAIMSNRVKCDLVATTGIHDGRAVIKQLLVGATAVQIASTIYKNGTKVIGEIVSDIEKWMVSKNYKSIVEFKGKMAQSVTTNPAAFERVQFMKYFREMKPAK